MVAQKSNFKIFSSKMTLTSAPPLLTYLRDIREFFAQIEKYFQSTVGGEIRVTKSNMLLGKRKTRFSKNGQFTEVRNTVGKTIK